MSAPDTDVPILPRARGRSVLQTIGELFVLALAPLALGGAYWVFQAGATPPEGPEAHTITARNMEVLDRRLANHLRRTGKVPATLEPVTFSAEPVDGFGHPLELVRLGGNRWELWSRGADGVRGGTGDDRDVSWSMLREASEAPADVTDTVAHLE